MSVGMFRLSNWPVVSWSKHHVTGKLSERKSRRTLPHVTVGLLLYRPGQLQSVPDTTTFIINPFFVMGHCLDFRGSKTFLMVIRQRVSFVLNKKVVIFKITKGFSLDRITDNLVRVYRGGKVRQVIE